MNNEKRMMEKRYQSDSFCKSAVLYIDLVPKYSFHGKVPFFLVSLIGGSDI
jgi:hypothetical protein